MYGIYEGTTILARFVVPLSVKDNVPVFAGDSLDLTRNVSKRPAQRWELTSALEPLSYGANEVFAYLVEKGNHSVIQAIMPQNIGVIKARTSTSTPTATGSAGATSVSVASNVGLIPRGCFIKFANHDKVYMTRSSLDGSGSLDIYPALRSAVSGTVMKHQDDVVISLYRDLDTVAGMDFTDGILQDLGSMKFVEK